MSQQSERIVENKLFFQQQKFSTDYLMSLYMPPYMLFQFYLLDMEVCRIYVVIRKLIKKEMTKIYYIC